MLSTKMFGIKTGLDSDYWDVCTGCEHNTRDPRFESSHRQILITTYCFKKLHWKYKKKRKKEARKGPMLKLRCLVQIPLQTFSTHIIYQYLQVLKSSPISIQEPLMFFWYR